MRSSAATRTTEGEKNQLRKKGLAFHQLQTDVMSRRNSAYRYSTLREWPERERRPLANIQNQSSLKARGLREFLRRSRLSGYNDILQRILLSKCGPTVIQR